MKTKINHLLGTVLSLLVTFGSTARARAQAPILFNSYIPGTPSQVYVVDADGANLKQLTKGKTSAGGASWHPSYQYISFFRDGSLFVMQALPESKSVRPFTIGGALPVGADFSPDGKRIVYCGPRPTDNQGVCIIVRTVDPARKKVGIPTVVWQGDSYAPSFSPDGSKIAFSSHSGTTDGGPHIKILDLVTGDVSSFDSIIGFIPTWRPDGQRIAFCGHTGEMGSTPGDAIIEVFLMNADFSGLTQVTNLGSDVAWPSFSPDGTQLAFTGGLNGGPAIYILTLTSGDVTLFQPEANAAHWAP